MRVLKIYQGNCHQAIDLIYNFIRSESHTTASICAPIVVYNFFFMRATLHIALERWSHSPSTTALIIYMKEKNCHL